MLYCILSQVKSLRDGVLAFSFFQPRLYHIGFKNKVCLSTVSEANSTRTYKIFENLFQILKFELTSKMHRQENNGFEKFTEFVSFFKARLLTPDGGTRFSKWKEDPSDRQKMLFPQGEKSP